MKVAGVPALCGLAMGQPSVTQLPTPGRPLGMAKPTQGSECCVTGCRGLFFTLGFEWGRWDAF